MRISNFASIGDVLPKPVDLEWTDLPGLLKHRFDLPSKNSAPLFSPAEWAAGAKREKATVQRVHLGVLDLDKITHTQARTVLQTLDTLGVASILYSTWSYVETLSTRNLLCIRVIVPFSRPVTIDEWPTFWQRFNAKLGGFSDTQCKDASRVYFYPASPQGTTEDDVLFMNTPGGPLDVEQLLHEAFSLTVDGTDKISIVQVAEYMEGLKAHHGIQAWMKAHVRRLIAGESLAKPGTRDDTLYKMTCNLVERFPNVDPVSLAELFKPSLAMMAREAPDSPTVADVESKIRRHQQEVQEKKISERSLVIEEKKERIRESSNGKRDTPYTQEEIQADAASMGLTPEQHIHSFLVQRDMNVYIRVWGEYKGPFNIHHELERAALTYLAPAASAGVELYYSNEKGKIVPKNFRMLMKDYGQIAMAVHIDLSAQKSHFDPVHKILTEAPCPLIPRKPTFHPIVHEYFTKLGGKNAPALMIWVAGVSLHDEPCAALFLEGPPGSGKTLFAEGIASLYTTKGPTALEDAFASFNSCIMNCPVVFGDEVVPKDLRGQAKTGELRQFIQARHRTLKRKYMADSTLWGCSRVILAANNKELLLTGETLTVNDIEAIVERVLHIETTQESVDFLKSLTPEERSMLVDGGWIAEHALWLRDNTKIDRSHRFIVEGNRDEMHRAMITQVGLRSAICNWCVGYLMEPKKLDQTKSLLIRKYKGQLLVSSRGLSRYWGMYETNMKALPTGLLTRQLGGLCEPERKQLTSGDGLRTWYRIIKPEYLFDWADKNNYATTEILKQLMEGTTPSDFKEDMPN